MGLKDKASKIDFSSLGAPAGDRADRPGGSERPDRPVPKTAPGALMDFAFEKRAGLEKEVDDLREQVAKGEDVQKRLDEALAELSAWVGAEPARRLNPLKVRPSRWANRHESNFNGAEFEAFCDELTSAGGNVQPIMVRPLANGGEYEYEIVFGHRRHAACLARKLPLLAVVSAITDRDLFAFMDRENRSRKDLSAFEQGRMYRRALDEGLYASMRSLAESVGVSVATVSKSCALAGLPDEVLAAFAAPLELTYRAAAALVAANERDPDGVLARARNAVKQSPRLSTNDTLDCLLGLNKGEEGGTQDTAKIMRGGKPVGAVTLDSRGKVVVRLEVGVLAKSQLDAFAKALSAAIDLK